MEFLSQYGLFLAQAVTIVISVGLIILLIAAASSRHRGESSGHIEVHKLNDRYKELRETLRDATLDPAMRKESHKAEKKAEKKKAKEDLLKKLSD